MRKRQILPLAISCALLCSAVSIPANVQATSSFRADSNTENADSSTTDEYVSRTLVSEENGLHHYTYTDSSGKTVNFKAGNVASSKKRKAANLPSSYSSVSEGKVTSIKNQGDTGACWAFGAIKALEGSAISKALASANTLDLSESHLAWYTYHPESNSNHSLYGDQNIAIDASTNTYGQGGDALMAISTLVNWWGAADESTAPFDSSIGGGSKMENSMARADENLRYQAEFHLQEANCYDNADISEIKQAVMDYGVVNVSHYFPESMMDARYMVYQNGNEYSMYQTRHSKEDANHSVSIVGWDDNYSAFRSQPKGTGAWLIANSWGEDSSYSDSGYYWVSYYDASLCDYYTFEAMPANTYQTNYGYDGAGYCGAMRYSQDTASANIFTNTTGSPQEIKAIGFYTLADNQNYEINVYRNVTGTTPDSGEYISGALTKGTASYTGFHTVTLAAPVSIAENETFSIVVTYKYNGQSLGIPLEGDVASTTIAISRFQQIEYKKYNSKEHQSYLYNLNEGWVDTTKYPNKSAHSLLFRNSSTNYNNTCIRAYGNNITNAQYDLAQKSYEPAVRSMNDVFTGKSATPVASPTPVPTPSTAPAEETIAPTPTSSTQTAETAEPVQPTTPAPTSSIAPTDGNTAFSPAPSAAPQESESPSKSQKIVTITPLQKSFTIGKGERVYLSYSLSGDDDVFFQSLNLATAKVNNAGVVTGTGTGKTKIALSTSTGGTSFINITVKKAPNKVNVSVKKTTMKKGQKQKLQVKLPSGSASYQITYQSSNKKIATISKTGVITAKKKGTVKFTVTTFNQKKKTIKIKVTA